MSTRRGGREGEGGLEKREKKTGVRRGKGRGRKRLDYEGEEEEGDWSAKKGGERREG